MGERKEKTVIQAEKAQATCCLQAEEEVGRGSSGAGSQRSALWLTELYPVGTGKKQGDISTLH